MRCVQHLTIAINQRNIVVVIGNYRWAGTKNPKCLIDECAIGWRATIKLEMLDRRMCYLLADNDKTSH